MPPSSASMIMEDEPVPSTTSNSSAGTKPQQERLEYGASTSSITSTSCSEEIVRQQRAVHWGVARIYPITPLSEYTPTSIRVTWYQPTEYSEMSRENSKLIDQLTQYGCLVGESSGKVTSRGLEHMTEEEIKRRKRLRDEAVDAVLDEQDRQYEKENRPTPTPEGVAAVYAPIALRASNIAQRIGLQDEEVAKAIAEAPEEEEAKETGSNRRHRRRRLPRKSRTVQFSPMVHVQTGLHLNEYTPEEVVETWYVEKDIQQFKLQSKRLIKSLLKSKLVLPEFEVEEPKLDESRREDGPSPPKPSNVCIRGLEPYLLSSKIGTRKENVAKTWNAVLDEQERQDKIHQSLPAHLAQASRDTSSQCIKVARRLAQQDQQFVAKYLAEELQEWGITFKSSTTSHQNHSPASRRGSTSSRSSASSVGKPPRARDYRRDSLSVAGAASKVAAYYSDIPESIVTSIDDPTRSEGTLRDAPSSPHPLRENNNFHNPRDFRRDSMTLLPLPMTLDEDDDGIPTSPTTSESSSSQSATQGFSMLRAMAAAAGGPIRNGRGLIAEPGQE